MKRLIAAWLMVCVLAMSVYTLAEPDTTDVTVDGIVFSPLYTGLHEENIVLYVLARDTMERGTMNVSYAMDALQDGALGLGVSIAECGVLSLDGDHAADCPTTITYSDDGNHCIIEYMVPSTAWDMESIMRADVNVVVHTHSDSDAPETYTTHEATLTISLNMYTGAKRAAACIPQTIGDIMVTKASVHDSAFFTMIVLEYTGDQSVQGFDFFDGDHARLPTYTGICSYDPDSGAKTVQSFVAVGEEDFTSIGIGVDGEEAARIELAAQ